MNKFICDNGSFEIQSSRESRNYCSNIKFKSVDISVSDQDKSIDDIEEILTEPNVISSFSIINEKTGMVLGTFEGYTLNNISKSTQGNSVITMINFTKGNE